MKILLTGGGTAGHVMPHLALLPSLSKHYSKIYYIGTNGIEKEIISKHNNIEFFEIQAVKFLRGFNLKNLLLPFKLIKSVNQCKKILKKIRPNVIFSKGGFVSVPVVIAARSLKIPVVSHESDKTLGLANKVILKYCNVMCTSFFVNSKNKKIIHTGSPVRNNLYYGNKEHIESMAKFHKSKKNILFMGGSLGAKAINNFVFNNIKLLTKNYNVLHIVGKNNSKFIEVENYLQMQYCNQIEDAFNFADIVICRSGANTIFELLTLKKLMILIPLPKANSRGDQIENAKYFEENNYAKTIPQENLTLDMMLFMLDNIQKEKDKYIASMSSAKTKNANDNILKIILENTKQN